jgi:hypothetical protein
MVFSVYFRPPMDDKAAESRDTNLSVRHVLFRLPYLKLRGTCSVYRQFPTLLALCIASCLNISRRGLLPLRLSVQSHGPLSRKPTFSFCVLGRGRPISNHKILNETALQKVPLVISIDPTFRLGSH